MWTHVSWWCIAARSVSEEFSSGCEGKSSAGSTGAPADQEHRPDHKQHRDKTPDDRDEGTNYTYLTLHYYRSVKYDTPTKYSTKNI